MTEQQPPTHSLWNRLTMRPDKGWAGNICTPHLEQYRHTKYLKEFEVHEAAEGDAPCYVCQRQANDPWRG